MTEDGRDGGAGGRPSDRNDGALPPELRGLDEELRRVRFDPRPGLEGEVLGRLSGERERGPARRPGRRRPAGSRRAVRAAAVLALVAAAGLLARAASDGGDGRGGGSPAAFASRDGPATGEERFALRWGPDARVLAVGAGAKPARGPVDRGLRCERVGGRLGCRGTVPGRARFATARGPAVLRDFCCLDYDGGGVADDGVRVVAGQGEAVVSFWIYEDRDGTGSFSDGDLLRTVLDGEGPGREPGGAAGRVRQMDRCCADLDGGPRSDDGIFVLAADGERVALAVLYEDVTGDGRLGPGDRLRALRTSAVGGGAGPGTSR